ncbi:MAG: FUSC family protein [Deltaproteobacteria bacterium]|nr:FUSC family protein [Deltaproteobacteria bacterium]
MDVAGGSSLRKRVFCWSGARAPRASQVVAVMLGLAGPIAAGVMVGHARMGMVMSLGGLALSGDGKGETFREQVPGLVYALVAGSAAMFTGSAMAGHDMLTAFGVPAIAAAAGLLGGISRPLARATTQFMVYTIIAANLGLSGVHPLATMLLFSLGAAWAAGLSLILRPLFQALGSDPTPHTPANVVPSPRRYAGQLLHRWWNSLAHLSGWQYALRITLCLATAEAFEWIFPHHHGYWVSITVVIVVQRNLQAALTRTLQRAAGTALGVLLVSLLLLGSPGLWAMISMLAVLAAVRPILKEANYTAYAAVTTPLIILLLDFGQKTSWPVIVDRLAATLAGCVLALTFGYLMWSANHPITGRT